VVAAGSVRVVEEGVVEEGVVVECNTKGLPFCYPRGRREPIKAYLRSLITCCTL